MAIGPKHRTFVPLILIRGQDESSYILWDICMFVPIVMKKRGNLVLLCTPISCLYPLWSREWVIWKSSYTVHIFLRRYPPILKKVLYRNLSHTRAVLSIFKCVPTQCEPITMAMLTMADVDGDADADVCCHFRFNTITSITYYICTYYGYM